MNTFKEQLEIWRALRSRGDIKRAGRSIDGNPDLRIRLTEYLSDEGWDIKGDVAGKRLLRMLLDRSKEAQVRKNPIHRNETFDCIFCGKEIPLPSGGIRDHCPHCLRSRHVDIVPGDRAANCRGRMEPIQFDMIGGIVWIEYRCTKCPHTYRVRAHKEDTLPYSLSVGDLPKSSI